MLLHLALVDEELAHEFEGTFPFCSDDAFGNPQIGIVHVRKQLLFGNVVIDKRVVIFHVTCGRTVSILLHVVLRDFILVIATILQVVGYVRHVKMGHFKNVSIRRGHFT